MSLVFDALTQHREHAAQAAVPAGSVLPGAERGARSYGSKAVWLSAVVLAGLGAVAGYQFAGQQPAPAKQEADPVAPASVAALPSFKPEFARAPADEGKAPEPVAINAIPPAVDKAADADKRQPDVKSEPVQAVVSPPVQAVTPRQAPAAAPAPVAVAPAIAPAIARPHNVVAPVAAVEMPVPAVHIAVAPVVSPAPQPAIAAPAEISVAKAVQPPPVTAMTTKEVALAMSRFNDAVRSGEFESAAKLLDRVAAGFGPDSLVALRMRGFLALKKGELQQARADYQQVVASLPNDYEANRNLAVIDLQQGNQELSRRRSRQMLELYPDDPVLKELAN